MKTACALLCLPWCNWEKDLLFANHSSSLPASCFLRRNLSCPKINPRCPTGSIWKAYKGNILKMLQLVIAERLFTVLLPGEPGLTWLLPLCVLVQRLEKKWAPRWSLPHDPRAGTVWVQVSEGWCSTGLEGSVSFSSPSATHHITAGMEPSLSACTAPSEHWSQYSLHVEWSKPRIFHFIHGKCNHFILC